MTSAPASSRLVLVEDADDDERLLVRTLDKAGLAVTVTRVETEAAFREVLAGGHFDAIVSDYNLPTFGAPRALEIYAELGLDVPFVVVSGAVGDEAAVALMRAGAHDFVSKSHLTRLPEVLRREMREARQREGLRVAEAALAREREAAARYLAIIPNLVLAVDRDARITLCNDAGARLLEGAPSQIVGRDVFESFARPGDRGVARELFAEVIRGARPAFPQGEVTISTLAGRERTVRFHTVLVRDDAGIATGALCSAEDITERVALEEHLRRAQKMDAIGRLAAAAAHDFNNVLTVILATAELVAEPRDAADLTEMAGTIVQAAVRGADLTRQLLAFARQSPNERKSVELAACVDSTLRMVRRLLGDRVRVESELVPGHRVIADAGHLDQVVMNLVVNARDAMPDGGRLRVVVAPVTLDAAAVAGRPLRTEGQFLALRVSDTGVGISPEHLKKIFDPFFTTKQPGSGTGLGLATVWGIVEKHGGFVEVESELGLGTTFSIFLPETDAPIAASMRREPEKPKAGATVLLIDDLDAVRRAVRRLLERHGHRILEATTAVTARELWSAHGSEVSLVITDVWLGGNENGHDLVRLFREQRQNLPVVLMSGDGGAFGNSPDSLSTHLRKPFRQEDLLAAVRRSLTAE